jgi:4-hydroxy-2-oxoheptanedioate aldolase
MLKKRLKEGDFVIGTWCDFPSPEVVNVIAEAGMDFVIIDMEHGSMDFRVAQQMVISAQIKGCSALVRVSRNDESDILRALDIGADGLIVPHVESIQDREKIIKYSKFLPVGERGFNPYVRSGNYHAVNKDYFEIQNANNLVGIIVEGENGIFNLEQIISDEFVDIVYIGTYDLSVVLGVPGDVRNKKVTDALETAVKKIRNKGKVAGCMIHNVEDLYRFKEIGIQFITYKVDTGIVYDACSSIKKELNK